MTDAKAAAVAVVGAMPAQRAAWRLRAAALSTAGRSEPATTPVAGVMEGLEDKVRQAAARRWRQRAGQRGSAIVNITNGRTRGRSHRFESVGRAWQLLRIGGCYTPFRQPWLEGQCAEGSSSASRAGIDALLACVTALASTARWHGRWRGLGRSWADVAESR